MQHITVFSSTVGGLLIGLGSAGVLLAQRRVAGVSGIAGGLLAFRSGDMGWRALFLVGLVAGGVAGALLAPNQLSMSGTLSTPWLVASGLLVGFGSRLGGGCTSGHGVCGLGRLSKRSMIATPTFMLTAGVVVFVVRHLLGAH
ncbi:MAG TPA: YeeE/YedE thiosulfate transporter family protein [Polyangiales bacterium]